MNWNSSSCKIHILFSSLLLFAVGCGSGASYNNSVEGVVTLDNEPLANVIVSFVPQSQEDKQAPISTAKTDEQGRFKLQYKQNGGSEQPGAVLGMHAVLVKEPLPERKRKSDDSQAMEVELPVHRIPSNYGVPGKTPLKVEVTADKHDYPLSLTSR